METYLKVIARSDEKLAARALQHFGGRAAVRLIEHRPGALLIERAVPGTQAADLSRGGRDDEAIELIARTAIHLHEAGLPPEWGRGAERFPTVADWGRSFARYRAVSPGLLPDALVNKAETMFRELERSQAAAVLLHGDLHHENLLLDASRGWLAIDPKGVIGEPAYEFGACLRNPRGEGVSLADYISPPRVQRRVRIITEVTGLDAQRIRGWAFAQAVLSAIWSWEDGEPPDTALAFAQALEPA